LSPSETAPATSKGARGYSWPPFQPGNALSRKHGLYSRFQMLEGKEEIGEIAHVLRGLLPLYASAFEVGIQLLSARLWRLRRAYEFIEKTPEGEIPPKFLESLNALENLVNRSIARLGLDPVSAAELGVSLSRLAAGSEDGTPPFQWSNLDGKERRTLERLLAKGRRTDDGE